ncbi:MAG: hypothetical protein E7E31_09900 [Bifidobacterium breve]|nr:hypothetical protein [Bifidobacterium breve]
MSRSSAPRAGGDPDGGALFGRQRLEEQAEHVPAVSVVLSDLCLFNRKWAV